MSADNNQMVADQLVADYLRRLREAARALPADRREELIEEITAHVAEARAVGAEGTAAAGDPLAVRNILDRLGDPAEIVRTAADPAFADGPAFTDGTGLADGTGPAGAPAFGGNPAFGGSPGFRGNPAFSGGPATVRRGPGPLEITTVVLLLVGGIVLPVIGWFVGVILLWVSPRWRARDKWIGTLVWPGGLLAPAVSLFVVGAAFTLAAGETVCSGSDPTVAPAAIADSHQAVLDACVSTGSHATLPVWLGISFAVILLVLAVAGPIYTAVRLLRRVQDAPAQPVAQPADLQPA